MSEASDVDAVLEAQFEAKVAAEEVAKSDGKAFNMDVIMRGYAMDCITRILFSLDTDSTRNPENEWCQRANNLISVFGFTLSTVAPWLCYAFNISVMVR